MLKAIFRRIDRSQFLIKLLERTSNLLAKRRGLPVVIGVVLIIISFVLRIINISTDNETIEIIGMITNYAGILIALIGLMLAEPLGK
jgi:hypothetical protein